MANRRLGDDPRKTVSYNLEPKVIEQILALAEQERRSASFVANELLQEALKRKLFPNN